MVTPQDDSATPHATPPAGTGLGPLNPAQVAAVQAGYRSEGVALELGALVNGEALPEVQIRIPISQLNRHGLIAGATGTGKTKSLQILLEQLSANGVPVFAADMKGDLSGVASPGTASEKLLARTAGIGQNWQPAASPVEFYSLGGRGQGVPIRATVTSFGPLMFAKILGLNNTQESSLSLVFQYADANGLPLVDLKDLRAVLMHLTSPAGKEELASLGGVSKQTAGVILRELSNFAASGADVFFGEPEIDANDFLRLASDGRGIVSLLQLPGVANEPRLFSTFLMWLLADLFNSLPEVGDLEKPKLVFFFDEAHLLFNGASKEFVNQVVQTVRLIRSKGVGVFFITQSPKDIPNDVLAQLGSRIQHQLRAHTPDDAKALKAASATYPQSGYKLENVLTQLGTGEAIITVLSESGAPTPTAWTRMRAPQGSMDPTAPETIAAAVAASPLLAKYGTPVDPESAYEILANRMNQSANGTNSAEVPVEDQARSYGPPESLPRPSRTTTRTTARSQKSTLEQVLGSRTGQTVVREVVRGVFNALLKRR
ncbi:helicase HerA-like domain-containing protein [Canibacter zhoujuaniae]|uniref:helicase HerA-like domain-containing protein n=1 Tax=Canibacter zhoujuaniae TaxID=2708343 RepID=UPI001FBBD09A|nr:helicase HerA-like domain-containing protein [Canibacter zhoujuaniae]